MRKLGTEEAYKVTGGTEHYHWSCGKHRYTSVARDNGSCLHWLTAHNKDYHDGAAIAKKYSCSANCGKIYTNYN